jgi:Fur family peroxide stress response transcriptional regulator
MGVQNESFLSKRLESVCARLRAHGHRVTPQRLAIMEFVFSSAQHPTAQQIYEALQARFPTMSLATVYKTLHLLEELEEVAVLGVEAEGARYDGAQPVPHAHLVCERCGAVVDAHGPAQQQDWLALAKKHGWLVRHWRLELLGLCPSCQSAPAQGQEPSTRADAAHAGGDQPY